MLRIIGALMYLVLAAPTAHGEVVRWRMATEYPPATMPGEGIASFMHEVNRRSGGTIEIVPLYQVSGIKSADVPAAVHEGQLDAGDAFGGALAGMDPIFSLSSLPFITATTEDARRLAELARPLYKAAFNRRGLHLLYVTPWPATGLWSNKPVVDIEALRALTVRTYDATSRRVIQEAGAKAENLSFTDVMPRLADGSITAVLSSGDGGAGRKLWKWLPNFTAVNYAMPLSFAVVNAHMYAALPPEQRQVVDEAAVATEDQQWARVQMRQVENTRRMQDAGVRIVQVPSLDVRLAMRGAAAQTVSEWMQRAGPDATSVLEHYECLSVRAAGHLPRTDR